MRVVSVVPSLNMEPRQSKIFFMSTEAHLHQKHQLIISCYKYFTGLARPTSGGDRNLDYSRVWKVAAIVRETFD